MQQLYKTSLPYLRRLELPLAIPILCLYAIVGAIFFPSFISLLNLSSILFSVAILLPAVLGMQVLLTLGRFDLSTGATAAFSGMVTAILVIRGVPSLAAVSLGLISAAIAGYTTGLLVTKWRVDPLIATLALLGILRSFCLLINDGRVAAGLPSRFGQWTDGTFLGLPALIWSAILLTLFGAVWTRQAVLSRRLYAVGNNVDAATRAGLHVPALIIFGYVLAAVGAGTTGLLQISRTLSASPLIFETLAIQAITACVVGGASLSGGKGGTLGAALGLLTVVATGNLVIIMGVSVYWQDLAVGCVLLIAILLNPSLEHLRRSLLPHQPTERHDNA